jgi:hypothetical protein
MKIVFLHKRVISLSNRHPFTLRRFWYLFHRHRKQLIGLFLKSFIKCGNAPGARTAIKSLIVAYAATKRARKLKTLRFVQKLKKIYFRKKNLRRNEDNITIYPTYLLKRIMRLKKMLIRCVLLKRTCQRDEIHCRRARRTCHRMIRLKRRINPKVRKIFINYFTDLWYRYIRHPGMRNVRVYIIRRYRRRWL